MPETLRESQARFPQHLCYRENHCGLRKVGVGLNYRIMHERFGFRWRRANWETGVGADYVLVKLVILATTVRLDPTPVE